MNVVYLPGLFESELGAGYGFPWPPVRVWVQPDVLLAGGLGLLQLDATGTVPGPLAQGRSGIVGLPYAPWSAPMVLGLISQGHRVLALAWDWRKDLVAQGVLAWQAIQPWAAGQPISLVSHSAGGLVSLAVYGAMLAGGFVPQLRRIITVGCPYYGAWATVLAWFRSHPTYGLLRRLCGWMYAPHQGQEWLDAICASWPSFYELMPFAVSGPLFQTNPQQALQNYLPVNYVKGNKYLVPGLFQQAQATQAQLVSWLNVGITWSIVGGGHPTIADLKPGGNPAGDSSNFIWTDGDGTVTVAEASPPGVPVLTVPTAHALQPLDPLVIATVLAILQS